MRSSIKAVALAATTAATVTALLAPALAGAASYPRGAEARGFHESAGGWQGSTSFEGLCVPAVNCPTVTNDFVANGGSGGQGDGYLRTRIGSLLGVGATSRGIYLSPSFKYTGASGAVPETLALDVSRRSGLASLLAVTGNSADYSVDLVDISQGGNATSVIDQQPIGDQDSWTAKTSSLPPGGLTLGDRYRIRITSEFETGVQVVPGGSVGYDDVVLRAKRTSNPGGGNGGHHSLAHRLRSGIGPAVRHGKRLSIRVRCPGAVRPNKCRMRVSALLKRGGPKATKTRRARLGAGKGRNVRLRVKRAHRHRVGHRHRILVQQKVRVGHRKLKVVKSVRIIRH